MFAGLAGDVVRVASADDEALVPLDDIARLEFGDAGVAAVEAGCTFLLSREGRIVGELTQGPRETVMARTILSRQTRLPFNMLRAVVFDRHHLPKAARELLAAGLEDRGRSRDLLVTVEGEQVRSVPGVLLSLGPKEGEFVFGDRTRRIRTSRIYAVLFARPASVTPESQAVVHLFTGDIVPGNLRDASADELKLDAIFGQAVGIEVEAIRSIVVHSDRVVYLSDVAPVSYRHSGLIHDQQEWRKDGNVHGGPISLAGRQHAKGLGVRSRSELAYDIGGNYEAFAATVGIDDAVRPQGSVVFRVLTDGDAAFDSGLLTGADEPVDLQVSTAAVARLTLIVDFGEGADIGDWADWGSARLIRPRSSR
jgi:hypothetical protein